MRARARPVRGMATFAMLMALVVVATVGMTVWLVMRDQMAAATRRVARCMVRLDCRPGGLDQAAPPHAPGQAGVPGWSGVELVGTASAAILPGATLPPHAPPSGHTPIDVAMASMVLAQASSASEAPPAGTSQRPLVDGGRDLAAVARCLDQSVGGAPATVFLPGILNPRGSPTYDRNAASAQALGSGPCVIGVPNGGGVPEGLEAHADARTVEETVGVLGAAAARDQPVDLLVHSNGTAVLLAALEQLTAAGVPSPLHDVTLVAPNGAGGGLERLEAATRGTLTVVVSTRDPALAAALFNDCNIDCVVDFVERHPEVQGVVLRMGTHSFGRQLEAARRLLSEEANRAARLGRPPRFPLHDVDTEEPG
jgi:hypothetical protein